MSQARVAKVLNARQLTKWFFAQPGWQAMENHARNHPFCATCDRMVHAGQDDASGDFDEWGYGRTLVAAIRNLRSKLRTAGRL